MWLRQYYILDQDIGDRWIELDHHITIIPNMKIKRYSSKSVRLCRILRNLDYNVIETFASVNEPIEDEVEGNVIMLYYEDDGKLLGFCLNVMLQFDVDDFESLLKSSIH